MRPQVEEADSSQLAQVTKKEHSIFFSFAPSIAKICFYFKFTLHVKWYICMFR